MDTAQAQSPIPLANDRTATQVKLTLFGITVKAIVVHTLTYFLCGLLALNLFDYATRFNEPVYSAYMRPTTDILVTAGVLFQPIRGILFGLVFYLLREVLFPRKNGWLVAWIMLVVVGILSTFGPAPASIEGIIYTKIPIGSLPGGMLEVITQSFLLSLVTWYWVNHPEKKWLNWVLGIAFFIAMALPALGMVVRLTTGN
jgi:hypothetical protein